VWITETQGAKRLQVGRPRFRRIVEAAGVRKQKLPGLDIFRYSAEDIEKVLRDSIIDAGQVEKARAS
jgi:hypothetical protein